LLHLRVYKNYLPAPAAQSTLFFSFQNGETVPSGTRRWSAPEPAPPFAGPPEPAGCSGLAAL